MVVCKKNDYKIRIILISIRIKLVNRIHPNEAIMERTYCQKIPHWTKDTTHWWT